MTQSKKLLLMRREWEGRETREVFEYCRGAGGVERSVDWEDVRKVPVYGYVEEAEGLRKRKFDEVEGEEEEGKVLGKAELEKVLVEYRAKHEGVEVELGQDGESVEVCF
jgi:hypothetical protein